MKQNNEFFAKIAVYTKEQGGTSTSVVVILFFCALLSKNTGHSLSIDKIPFLLDLCSPKRKEELLSHLQSLDETLLNEIIEILMQYSMAPIFTGSIDSALHDFYPAFLKIQDKEQWRESGTFYTDPCIAHYMIQQIDDYWKEEYGVGLADAPAEQCRILDPALGSAVFLHSLLSFIRDQKKQEWKELPSETKRTLWAEYLSNKGTGLLRRILGIELDPTALLLAEFRILWLLRNDLDLPFIFKENDQLLFLQGNALSFESLPFSPSIIIGNPPYNARSKQEYPWILEKLEDYKYTNGKHFQERKHWLSDSYVKFIRLAQHHLDNQPQGLLCFITPNGFLSNPSFRSMRWTLLQEFSMFRILDLQGNPYQSKNKEDQNLFPIQQGIAISLMGKSTAKTKVYSHCYSGSKEAKLQLLQNYATIPWQKHHPQEPFYSFLPLKESPEYQRGFSLKDLFQEYSTGLQTGNESLLTADSPEELQERFSFSIEESKNIRPYLHKPFQVRHLLYIPKVQRSQFAHIPLPKSYRIRESVSQHMLSGSNIALHFARSNKSNTIDHFFISRYPSDLKAVERTTGSVFAPLYRCTEDDGFQSNLDPRIIDNVSEILKQKCTPIELIHYIYAILYSPIYRKENQAQLRIDFPIIPYPKDLLHFQRLQKLGKELCLLQLLEHPMLSNTPNRFPCTGSNIVEKIRYSEERLWINEKQYFAPITPEIMDFKIGSYPIAQRWLKAHKGQQLSSQNISEFNAILRVLEQTIQLMQRIDQTA